MKRPSWSTILATLNDFATTVGLPLAKRDTRTGEWSGVGVSCSAPNPYGQVKLTMRTADGSEWPIGSLTQPVALNVLPMIADMIVQIRAWSGETTPIVEPIAPAIADAQAFMRSHARTTKTTCPRCHRKIGGDFLPCLCPPDETAGMAPVELLAKAVTTLRNAEARMTTAVSTARLEDYERNDLRLARQELRETKTLIEAAAVNAPRAHFAQGMEIVPAPSFDASNVAS